MPFILTSADKKAEFLRELLSQIERIRDQNLTAGDRINRYETLGGIPMDYTYTPGIDDKKFNVGTHELPIGIAIPTLEKDNISVKNSKLYLLSKLYNVAASIAEKGGDLDLDKIFSDFKTKFNAELEERFPGRNYTVDNLLKAQHNPSQRKENKTFVSKLSTLSVFAPKSQKLLDKYDFFNSSYDKQHSTVKPK